MIHKNQIKEMARTVLKRQHGLKDPQLMHPEREWSIGLIVGGIIFFFSVVWSIYAYIENKNVSFEQTAAPSENVVVYRESLVKAALQKFEERDAVVGRYLKGVTRVPEIEMEPVATSSVSGEESELIEDEVSTTPSVEEE